MITNIAQVVSNTTHRDTLGTLWSAARHQLTATDQFVPQHRHERL